MTASTPMQPLVSVIVPVKNREEMIAQALDSLRWQTHEAWEAIVVDDGSEDGTARAVRDYAARDGRIRLIERAGEGRRGAPAARNAGLAEARGEFVLFLDSDDMLAPECLAGRIAFMRKHPELDFAVFRARIFDHTPGDRDLLLFNRDTGEDDLERFLRYDVPWQTAAPLWRRAAAERVAPWDEMLKVGQDVDLHCRALIAGLRYRRCETIDLYLRNPGLGRSSVGADPWRAAGLTSHGRRVRRLESELCRACALTESRRHLLAGNWFWLAQQWGLRGRSRRALACWRRAERGGLVSMARWREGAFLLRHQHDWLGPYIMYYLCRRWPARMFIFNTRNYYKAGLDDARLRERVPFERRHPGGRYQRILRGGLLAHTAWLLRTTLPGVRSVTGIRACLRRILE